jgi:anti-sigma regulatory factor (Ser/Thr protein kinase)
MTAELVEELFGHARAESVRPLRRAVARVAISEGADREVVRDLTLCVHEALVNVVRHAYEASHPGPFEVRVVRAPQELVVVVRDMGRGLFAHRAGDFGYGLRLMSRLSRRFSMAASPGGGTEVRMSFPLGEPGRVAHGRARDAA